MIAFQVGLVLIMISTTRVPSGFTKTKNLIYPHITFFLPFVVSFLDYLNVFCIWAFHVACASDDEKFPIKLQLGVKVDFSY